MMILDDYNFRRQILITIALVFSVGCFGQSSFYSALADSALTLTEDDVIYDPGYYSIPYPAGDIPQGRGVCTDVVIRAYRKMGIDLQQEVHEDMRNNFAVYPRNWGLTGPDPNIDHRRVPNLMKFFERKGEVLEMSSSSSDYNPGDIVCWDLGGGITHIGIVSSLRSDNGKRYLIIHNIGQGQVVEDILFQYRIIGHYRYNKMVVRSSKEIVQRVSDHWFSLHNNFKKSEDVWGNYTLDLTLEALLYYDRITGGNRYTDLVLDVFRKRNIAPGDTIDFRTQPFCSINFTLGEITGDSAWFAGYIPESYRMYHNAVTSPEGAIMHSHKGNQRILIDYLQEYASRLAKTGYLTGDTALFAECVDQFLRYEKLLKNRKTGLWSQGRGWCEDTTMLSEGAWSRGHGWLLRGLVTSLVYLPDDYRIKLKPILKSVSESLEDVQDSDGMYHILLNLPPSSSAPDVSGTGMIIYYQSLAVSMGWLSKESFEESILKGIEELRKYVSDDGAIRSSSKGPGPLCTHDEYIHYIPEPDEPHGFQGMIYGMCAEMVLF